ncbi:MAG: hypothetical protein NTV86_10200 [Planctomycetota bacterium]|nr:hypothetical protein [Planctomycetota bacterium]
MASVTETAASRSAGRPGRSVAGAAMPWLAAAWACLAAAGGVAWGQQAASGPASRPGGEGTRVALPGVQAAGSPIAPAPGKVEVIGLTLQGRRVRERVEIDDLASVTAPDGTHLLPLLRLAKLLDIEAVDKDPLVEVAGAGGKAVLHLTEKTIEVAGRRRRIELAVAATEMVGHRDIFVTPGTIAELLGVDMRWNESEYAYQATTARPLKIWEISQREWKKLLQVGPELPQLHGRAEPADNALHFWSTDLGFQHQRMWEPSGRTDQTMLAAPQHSLWGRLGGGAFRIDMVNPSWVHDETGSRFDPGQPVFALNWAEWVHRGAAYEVVVGDSYFGLSELVFPRMQQTGIKMTALSGFTAAELAALESMPELGRFYGRTRTFEGLAPVRSRVELRVNGRVIDVQEALADSTTPPGMGRYRFVDAHLPAGVLSQVQIVITEPSGTQKFEKREFYESRLLLPAGHGVYLGTVGTRREPDVLADINGERKVVGMGRAYGVIAGTRALYGVTDELLVGAVFGIQRDIYRFEINKSKGGSDRPYPVSSAHAGGVFGWSPDSRFDLSGEWGLSNGEGDGQYEDWAARLEADWHGVPQGRLHAIGYDYQPDYFDGARLDLRDRRGYQFDGRWKAQTFEMFGAYGSVRDNLDGRLDRTQRVDYNTAEASGSICPGVTALAGTYGSYVTATDMTSRLHRLSLWAGPWMGWDATLEKYFGDDLGLEQSGLLEDLDLTGVPDQTSPMTSLTVSKSLTDDQRVGARYRQNETAERASLFHAFRGRLGRQPYQLYTEFGHNYKENAGGYFLQRSELYLDPQGDSRVGFEVEHDGSDQWRAMAFLEIHSLVTTSSRRAVPVSQRQVTPERGAVRGWVFVDYNGNGLRDPGEPGLAGVRVSLGSGRSAVTDANGFYLIPSRGAIAVARVSLELDTVPAIYSPSHATQEAHLLPNSATDVDLAVMPLISLGGYVKAPSPTGELRGVSGLTVRLYKAGQARLEGESVTAGDGGYYFGDLRPGRYRVEVDPATLPPNCQAEGLSREVSVSAGKDVQMLQTPPIVLRSQGVASRPSGPSTAPATPPLPGRP